MTWNVNTDSISTYLYIEGEIDNRLTIVYCTITGYTLPLFSFLYFWIDCPLVQVHEFDFDTRNNNMCNI